MTKRELIEALKPYPDDAIIDVRCPTTDGEIDCDIARIAETVTYFDMTWVTLGVY